MDLADGTFAPAVSDAYSVVNEVKKNMIKQNLYATAVGAFLTAISYLTALSFGWITSIDWLEFFAVFTSYSCTYLCVVQSRTNYIWAVASVAAYSLLFYKAGLFGSMALNLYLIPTVIWGWYRWRPDDTTRPVKFVELKWWPVYLALSGAVWYAMSHVSAYYGGTLSTMDSFILAASILAQFLLDQKKAENWAVWAIVNVVAIKVYLDAGLFIVALQYVFFLANTVAGTWFWWKSMKSEEVKNV